MPGFGPEDRYTHRVPARVRDPGRRGQRSAGGRGPARRPPGRQRRAGDAGRARPFTLAGGDVPGRLVRRRHAPAQARPGQRDAGGRARTSPPRCRRCTTSPAGATACCGARRSTSAAGRACAVHDGAGQRPPRRPAVDAAPGRDLRADADATARTSGRVNALLDQGVAVRWRGRRHGGRPGRGARPRPRDGGRPATACAFTAAHRGGCRHRRSPRPVIAAAVAGGRAVRAARDGLRGPPGLHRRAERRLRLVRRGRAVRVVRAVATPSSTRRPGRRGRVPRPRRRGHPRRHRRARSTPTPGCSPATAVAGRGDANGVVAVRHRTGPVGSGSLPHSFVYSPLWFTGLGPGVTVEQRYAAGDPLVAGHWLPERRRHRRPGAGGRARRRWSPA